MSVSMTVAVCTYNRAERLPACLNSLVGQEFGDLYEVIVVDDGSTDDTGGVVSKVEAASGADLQIRYVRHPVNRGLNVARNSAIEAARGKIVAFTDDDCVATPSWLQLLEDYHAREPEVAAVGGLAINGLEGNLIAEIAQHITVNKLFKYHDPDTGRAEFLVGNNMSFKKWIFDEVGGFDQRIRFGYEEVEFESRLLSRGYEMLFVPEAIIIHYQYSTLWSMVKQYYKYEVDSKSTSEEKSALAERLAGTKLEVRRSLPARVRRVLAEPGEIAERLSGPWAKAMCYPVVYLASVARGMGLLRAAFSRKTGV